MNIAVCGSTGFLGKSLIEVLKSEHSIYPIHKELFLIKNIIEITDIINHCDTVINLAGYPINKKWNSKNIDKIIDSRVNTTLILLQCINNVKKPIKCLINASAIGIYDYSGIHDESSTKYSNDFLSEVVKLWEKAFYNLPYNVINSYITRIGIVLDKKQGIFPKLILPYKLFTKFIPGDGQQGFSFIHIDDLTRAIQFLIDSLPPSGIYNLVAPEYYSFSQLSDILCKYFKTFIKLKIPEKQLWFIMGNKHILLTKGQKVIPKKLIDYNFSFLFPNIHSAISNLVSK